MMIVVFCMFGYLCVFSRNSEVLLISRISRDIMIVRIGL